MKPLGWLAVSFMAGIFTASFISIPFFYVLAGCAVFLLAALLSIENKYFYALLIISSPLLGYLVYENSITLPPNHIRNFTFGREASLKGMIASDVEEARTIYGARKSVFVMQAESLGEDEKIPVTGLFKVFLYGSVKNLSYGDELILTGKLSEPQPKAGLSRFDYKAYLAHNGIYAILTTDRRGIIRITEKSPNASSIKKLALLIRKKADNIIYEHLPFESASVLSAILLGKRGNLPSGLQNAFINTGTVHILAISGLNVGLVAFIFYMVLSAFRLNRQLSTLLIICLITLYAIVTGWQIPVVRATIMIVIMLIGVLVGRDASSLNSLALAAIITLLVNPKQIFLPSFQLSYAAVFALINFTPKLDRLFRLEKLAHCRNFLARFFSYTLKVFTVSLAAWIGTAGLVAYHFNIISPVGLLANLIVVPVSFFVIASGATLLTFYFLVKPLTALFAASTAGIISFLEFTVETLNRMPLGYFNVEAVSTFALILYYAAVLVIFNIYRRKV